MAAEDNFCLSTGALDQCPYSVGAHLELQKSEDTLTNFRKSSHAKLRKLQSQRKIALMSIQESETTRHLKSSCRRQFWIKPF